MDEQTKKQATAEPDWLPQLADWTQKIKKTLEETLRSLLDHELTLTPQPPRFHTAADIEELFPDGPVLMTFRFSGAEIGEWNFLCQRSLAATIGDLALMGQGNVPFDETVHPSGLGEVWSQAVSALEGELKTLVQGEVTVEPPKIALDPTPFLKKLRSHPVVTWDLEIEEIGSGFLLHGLSPEFGAFLKPVAKRVGRAPRAAAPDSKPRPATPPPVVRAASFEDLPESPAGQENEPRNIDMLLDISLPITIELGRTSMLIRDVLQLGPGSVIELDKVSGEPVDLYVNDRKFARGEVVVIEENFGVRITELIRVDERVKALGGNG